MDESGKLIKFDPDGFNKKDKDFFPTGKFMPEADLLIFAEKIHVFPMSLKDKNEVLKKVKDLAGAEELQEIAINKSMYLNNLQTLQKYDISRLIEILKNNSLEYFKNDVPFAKAILDSIIVNKK
jgi:hypothetical protein